MGVAGPGFKKNPQRVAWAGFIRDDGLGRVFQEIGRGMSCFWAMPLTGPVSYLPVADEFLDHWSSVESALGDAGAPGTGAGGGDAIPDDA